MEKLILKDQTEIKVENGSYFGMLVTYVDDYAALGTLAASLTSDNLSDIVIGGTQYQHATLNEPHFKITDEGGRFKVKFGLRELTEAEVKLSTAESVADMLTDEQAVTVKDLYDEYVYGKNYIKGNRAIYKGILYKCLQDHTSQEGWEPGVAPSLWVALESGSEAGTVDDPIPVPDTVTTSGMEYEYGKYYKEGDSVYLCKRGGVADPESMYGQKVTLYYAPSALVGQYFEVTEA